MQSWSISWKSKRSVIHKQKGDADCVIFSFTSCLNCFWLHQAWPLYNLLFYLILLNQVFSPSWHLNPALLCAADSYHSHLTLCHTIHRLPRRFSTLCRRQMTSRITLSKTQQDMLHANLSSELRFFSCAKKLYLHTFGTKEGVVYKPDENYLVHFLVQMPPYFAPARIATNGCLGFPSHESGHLFPPSQICPIHIPRWPKEIPNGISTCDSLSP
jgi:hypothetical protein